MSQKLILNVIPFRAPIQEKEFVFYTKKQEGFCPIHKADLRGVIEGLVEERELDEGNWLYTDFLPAKNGAIILSVDLNKSIYFAAHYYRHLIREHFKNVADVIRPNFTKEIEVWFKSDVQPSSKFILYDLYTLKVQHNRITQGPELIVSYDGTTKLLNRNLLNLNNLPTERLNWIKCDKELHRYKYLPLHYKHQLENLYPVLSNGLKPFFGIPFDKPDFGNRYPKYWEKLNKFYTQYLNTTTFKKLIPLCPKGFHEVQANEVQTTLPGSKDLLFGQNRVSTQPKYDMLKYGPYKPANAANVRFIFIYQQSDRKGAVATLYKYFNEGIYEKQQDGSTKQVFPPISQYIKQPLRFDDKGGIAFTNLDTAEEEVRRQVKVLEKAHGVHYIAIYVTPVNKFVLNPKQKQLYYRIKEILLQEGITSQVVFRENISKTGFKYFLPNIEVAILAKLGGIPWRLNREKSDELIVGIGAFYSRTRKTRYVGSSFCFNNDGTFEGFDCFSADDTMMLAGSIRRAVTTFVAQFYQVQRLIIHFYKDISKKELQPIEETLHKLGLNIPVIVVTINKTESKELLAFDTTNTNLMPYSGSILKVGRQEYLLFNNTRYDQSSKVSDKEYHFPIKVSFACNQKDILEDENSITELMDQIYQFSRMYWKSVSQQNLPVTIKYPEMVAQIYPHFQSNTLPEFARKNLWFL